MSLKHLFAVLVFCASCGFGTSAFAGKFNFKKMCAKECPAAKTNEEFHSCVESKESDPEFQKTKCAKEHAEHEKHEKGHKDDHGHK
ncbi:MAG: hypothetical protein AB7O96_16615 [Pseudobdellovibrionaceae bacterium]